MRIFKPPPQSGPCLLLKKGGPIFRGYGIYMLTNMLTYFLVRVISVVYASAYPNNIIVDSKDQKIIIELYIGGLIITCRVLKCVQLQ